MTKTAVSKKQPQLLREKATYDQYLTRPDKSLLVEWVDGEVLTYLPPTDEHQSLSQFLMFLISGFARILQLGAVRNAPFEVKLWEGGPSREPDILFIRQGNLERLTDKRVVGAPDLVIEIASPGTVRIDRVEKFLEYQQAGVQEYWIIDPRPHQQQADFYMRQMEGNFKDQAVDEVGIYHAEVLPGFWLKPAWLWQERLPNPQVVLAEIMAIHPQVSPAVRDAYRNLYQALTGRPLPDQTSH